MPRLLTARLPLRLSPPPEIFAERVYSRAVEQRTELHVAPNALSKGVAVGLAKGIYPGIGVLPPDLTILVAATIVETGVAISWHFRLSSI
jgi:hypothetical protein